ncbi:MAG TPA: PLDc N-terminal domain-containing protein [Microbacterium sp.]|nr:PLDc N-terminal domain-containing protein [Microbacterium sp.]
MVILSLLPLVLAIVALVDVITRDDSQVKHLPKMVWVLLIVLLPLIGSIVWFAAGREWGSVERSHSRYAEPIPVRRSAASRSETERQLAELEAEIEYYEQQQRLKALEAEVEERRKKGE